MERPRAASKPPFFWLWRAVGALAVLLVTSGLLLTPINSDYRALWCGAVLDALHVPMFAAFAIAGACLLPTVAPWHILLASALFACVSEAIQPLVGRSASWIDLVYGLLGVAIAGVLQYRRWSNVWRLTAVTALLLWPLTRTLPMAVDAWTAWRSFPVLATFERPWDTKRWLLQRAEMVLDSEDGALIRCEPSEHGSGAVLLPVVQDWSRYATLEIDFAIDGQPLIMLISVRDGKKLPPELPRFDLWRRYSPGRHKVRISLDELVQTDKFPPIELDRIQSLHLLVFSDHERTVRLTRVELVGRR